MATMNSLKALVSRSWLRQALAESNRDLRILEVSRAPSGHEVFLKKHIRSSQYLSLLHCSQPSQTIPFNLPEPDQFTEYVRSLGVNHDSHIVLYDKDGLPGAAACRAWWVFRFLGHRNVSVLDGHLSYYEQEDNALLSANEERITKRGNFEVNIQRDLFRTLDDFKADVESSSCSIVDTRLPQHFSGQLGEPSEPTKRALAATGQDLPKAMIGGHVPGAINVPFTELTDPSTGLLHNKDELMNLFRQKGVDLDKPLTTTCYLGFTACMLGLATVVCGKHDTAVYYATSEAAPKSSSHRIDTETSGFEDENCHDL